MSIPANTDRFASGAGVLSVLKDAKPNPELAAFAEAASSVSRVAVAEFSLPPEFLNTRARLIGEYVAGQSSLEQAMAQMQETWTRRPPGRGDVRIRSMSGGARFVATPLVSDRAAGTPARRRSRNARIQAQRAFLAYMFILPCIALLALFMYYPAFSALYHSFFDWDGFTRATFVGLANFARR